MPEVVLPGREDVERRGRRLYNARQQGTAILDCLLGKVDMKTRIMTSVLMIVLCGTMAAQDSAAIYQLDSLASGSAINPTEWDIPSGWSELQLQPLYSSDTDSMFVRTRLLLRDDGTGYYQKSFRPPYTHYGEPQEFKWRRLLNGYIQYEYNTTAESIGGARGVIGFYSALPDEQTRMRPVIRTHADQVERVRFWGDTGIKAYSDRGVQNFEVYWAELID